MADASTTLPAPPKSRAAFSRDDVPDAKRGYPDFDLREFASRRGLEWLDHTTPAGYRAAVPGKEELQSNTLRGELAGGEYGVLAHEGLEVGYSAESFDWGGTFYGVRVRTGGVGLKGLLPFSGRANEALVRVPCTVAGVRLPESVGTQLCLRIDTRRSSPPFSFGHQIKLDELIGIDGWSVWGLPKVEPDALAALVREHAAGRCRPGRARRAPGDRRRDARRVGNEQLLGQRDGRRHRHVRVGRRGDDRRDARRGALTRGCARAPRAREM